MIRRAVALAALVLMAGTGTAQAKADDSKADCKSGGFVSYVDPATGQPFANQGACVSYVVHGGELVPVRVPLIEVYSIGEPIEGNWIPADAPPYIAGFRLSGFEPDSTVALHYEMTGVFRGSGGGPVTVDSAGSYEQSTMVFCRQQVVITATSGDLSAAVTVPQSPNCPAPLTGG